MLIDRFSTKQVEAIAFGLDERPILVADGSVRSGKTLAFQFGFPIWAMENYDRKNFILAAKTVTAAERNLISPMQTIDNYPYELTYRRSDRVLIVKGNGGRENYFYVFGGKDEASYALIQGLTASGAYFDEVALQPKSFVDQAIARTLAEAGSKLWFNCNPEYPEHFFFQEYIANPRADTKRMHFTMEDNPVMTPELIEKAKGMFSGVFYQRYILGQWVRAEGLIFGQFADNPQNWLLDELNPDQLQSLKLITFGVDYGENTSHTVFVATGITHGARDVFALAERKLDSKGVDPVRIESAFMEFVKDVMNLYPGVRLTYAFCDHPETITNGINARLKKERLPVSAVTAQKEEINTRIYAQEKMLNLGKMRILRRCPMLIHSLRNQVWDSKKSSDVRLDSDPDVADVADAWEYCWESFIDELGVRL